MAVEIPLSAIPEDPMKYPRIEFDEENKGKSEIKKKSDSSLGAAPSGEDEKDMIYVMVGKEVKESELTLKWALRKSESEGRKLCICHVHIPSQKIPLMGTKFSISQLEENQVRAYHETERENMLKNLMKYGSICKLTGVQAEKLYIEKDSIEKGIFDLITQHGIRKLVMGAAADKLFSKKMKEPKSKKAIYVQLQAPRSCHIWFICKGQLIYTRDCKLDGVTIAPLSLPSSPNFGFRQQTSLISGSVTEGQHCQLKLNGSAAAGFQRTMSEIRQIELLPLPPSVGFGQRMPCIVSNTKASFDEPDVLSKGSQVNSQSSSCFCTSAIEDPELTAFLSERGTVNKSESSAFCHFNKDHPDSSPPSVLEGSMDDDLCSQLDQYAREAEDFRREAYEESIRRRKAEKEAIQAIYRVKAAETRYAEELKLRKEVEDAVGRGKEEIEGMKQQLNKTIEELQIAREQKLSLENQIADSDKMAKELVEKIFSAVDLLKKYKKERDEFLVERDNALVIAEGLRKKQGEEGSATSMPTFFTEFAFSEIEQATRSFDPSLKIGEGGYGSIYKGTLWHTPVAIKILHSHSLQGPSEFQQEVNILSKLRHPNLVTLIGACSESWTLVYEYLPNGSLEDRLSCRDNTPPLSWQTRICIAAELCSVLIFLHSSGSRSIVHGDLKPSNILLDANYASKLSDFGICRVISPEDCSRNNTTLCHITDPKGTFAYMDPEYLETGELTPKSDVYSFGIILLILLTGRSALRIKKEVEYALDKGSLKDLLDPTAGDWPFVQANQLAHLAMSCCNTYRRNRPDLASEVRRVLEPMRVSCGFSSLRLGSKDHRQIPAYFICPIFQEIMQDPAVAADGFTYEAEALKGWLDVGNDTSPMTNLKLAHSNFVPNLALRSAIQEWLQHK